MKPSPTDIHPGVADGAGGAQTGGKTHQRASTAPPCSGAYTQPQNPSDVTSAWAELDGTQHPHPAPPRSGKTGGKRARLDPASS